MTEPKTPAMTPDGNVVFTTEYFIIHDDQGHARKIYRFGCARCGKPTEPGRMFCDGHKYMEGTGEAALRGGLEEIERQEQTQEEQPTTLLDTLRRWVRGRGDGATP